MHLLHAFAEALAAALAVCGCGYSLLCWWAARNFRRAPPPPQGFAPPVSILKPLRGADPGMYESFRSHCEQDYPGYELIFGVSDPRDPAIAEVERLQREFPQRSILLIVCDKVLGPNVKVSNLAQMLPHARHDFLLVNDSDMRVERDYLSKVMAPFADAGVGMVTCLYRGVSGATFASRLEAVGINTDFSAGVLVARLLQGIKFGLGSTLAFSRAALQAIGGFEPLLDFLADDYQLGARIAASGRQVVLADTVPEHHLPDYSFAGFLQHQLRWDRAVRDSRPAGYTGLGVTFALPWSMLAVVLSLGAAWSWALLLVTFALRALAAIEVGAEVLRDRGIPRQLWLLPLRDTLALLLWIASFTGHTITWRGDRFVLNHGRLRRA